MHIFKSYNTRATLKGGHFPHSSVNTPGTGPKILFISNPCGRSFVRIFRRGPLISILYGPSHVYICTYLFLYIYNT